MSRTQGEQWTSCWLFTTHCSLPVFSLILSLYFFTSQGNSIWTQPDVQKALENFEKCKAKVLAAKITVSLEEFLKYFKIYVFIYRDYQNYVDFWLNWNVLFYCYGTECWSVLSATLCFHVWYIPTLSISSSVGSCAVAVAHPQPR